MHRNQNIPPAVALRFDAGNQEDLLEIWDYVILAGVAIWLFAAVWYIVRQKKRGKCAGCGGCTGCSEVSGCQKNKEKETSERGTHGDGNNPDGNA